MTDKHEPSTPPPSTFTPVKCLKVTVAITIAFILWEHFAGITDPQWKPSVWLLFYVDPLYEAFITFGTRTAQTCSYLYHMQIKRLAQSAWDFFSAVFWVVCTPLGTIKGFIEQAYTYVDGPWMVYVGFVLLVGGVVYGLYKCHTYIPIINRIQWDGVRKFVYEKRQVVGIVLVVFIGVVTYYIYNYVEWEAMSLLKGDSYLPVKL